MFRWMQTTQATPFTLSKEGHTIIFEMLFALGGAAGLSQAVLLCCDVHAEGILKYYTLPTGVDSGADNQLPSNQQLQHGEGNGGVTPGRGLLAGDVILDGTSHIQAVVVLLAWLRSLRDHARFVTK